MTTRRPTVLVADDHTIVMEGLVSLLKAHDFDVLGAFGDGEALLDAARRLRPDVIVTDLTMPGLTGLDVLLQLKEDRIPSKVVVLTMHNDGKRAAEALRAGASGFLLKESAGEELITAISQALQGRVYLTPAVTLVSWTSIISLRVSMYRATISESGELRAWSSAIAHRSVWISIDRSIRAWTSAGSADVRIRCGTYCRSSSLLVLEAGSGR